jgi:hypothetical protein
MYGGLHINSSHSTHHSNPLIFHFSLSTLVHILEILLGLNIPALNIQILQVISPSLLSEKNEYLVN